MSTKITKRMPGFTLAHAPAGPGQNLVAWVLITDKNRPCVQRGYHRHDPNAYLRRCLDCDDTATVKS